jgi:hypothetical protein
MIDTGLRLRVERLLRGDFRVEDVTTLFLALRDRCDGREAIGEIGDFVAHRDERTKGITTKGVRDFFTNVKFIARFRFAKERLDLTDLPSNFMDVLYGTFKLLDNKVLKSETGLKRAAAEMNLINLGTRLHKDAAGKSFLAWPTKDDLKLITCLTRHLIVKPAFDGDTLFREFCDTLISNGILARKELRAFSSLKSAIALYAIAYMHECVIDLGDGNKAQLWATPNSAGGALGVNTESEIFWAHLGGTLKVAGTIFQTSLLAASCCETELLQKPSWDGLHIELTGKKTLSLLT